MKELLPEEKILSIDIGGSNIKATTLDAQGSLQNEYKKVPTPQPADPASVLEAIQELVKNFDGYDKISVGFPGYVRNGRVLTAPNLDTALWRNVNLQEELKQTLNKPVRLVNDADLQGLGVVKGKGLEMVITLGTGFGTALLLDGNLLPHLELAHHPVCGNKTYDQYIGEKAFKKHGEEKWNSRMVRVLAILKAVFNYDHLFISGGNASKLRFKLDENITIVSNRDGIKGGARLWQQGEHHFVESEYSAF